MIEFKGEQVVYLCLKDKLGELENAVLARLNVVLTNFIIKVLGFSHFLIERYKAQIQTDLLPGLREISRETDKLLKQQIVIRSKLENPS